MTTEIVARMNDGLDKDAAIAESKVIMVLLMMWILQKIIL